MPFGSGAEAEAASLPGDVIVVLPGDEPLDGGIQLKTGQVLRGSAGDSERPVLTNSSAERLNGVGIILADNTRVENITLRGTHSSGIFTSELGSVTIENVLIENANMGNTLAQPAFPPIPHGGITLLTGPAAGSASAILDDVNVLESTGAGVILAAETGSQATLSIIGSKVIGGAPLQISDYGVAVLSSGKDSNVSLELARSEVAGRMSMNGRNVLLLARDHSAANGVIYQSRVGESGQDGVLGVNWELPAQVGITIIDSTIEDAAQSNIEGTYLAFPHEQADVIASSMDVVIHGSIIRNAGTSGQFGPASANVLLTNSPIPPGRPLPLGPYTLRITDSEILSGAGAGLVVGASGNRPVADPGLYDVLVRGTSFIENASYDLVVGAPAAMIDARRNCWISPDGPATPRVEVFWSEDDSHIDTESPTACGD
ncbi:MAG: hypothetical protein AAGG07_14240 [Planctomycetota bacterium]